MSNQIKKYDRRNAGMLPFRFRNLRVDVSVLNGKSELEGSVDCRNCPSFNGVVPENNERDDPYDARSGRRDHFTDLVAFDKVGDTRSKDMRRGENVTGKVERGYLRNCALLEYESNFRVDFRKN